MDIHENGTHDEMFHHKCFESATHELRNHTCKPPIANTTKCKNLVPGRNRGTHFTILTADFSKSTQDM